MDLRETISAAVASAPAEVDTPVVASTPAPAPDSAPVAGSPASAPVLDDSAPAPSLDDKPDTPPTETFTSKVKSIEDVVAGPSADKEAAKPATPAPANIDRAPASWKGDAKKVWEGLPAQARHEVIRRERDTAKALQENAQYRAQVEPIAKLVQEHRDILQTHYQGNPVAALQNMMTVDRNLTTGTPESKAKFVAHIIKQFGIDLQTLDSVLAGTQAQPSGPNELERLLDQRLAPVMSFVESQRQAERQTVQQTERQAVQTVEQMAADPAFPYFEDVRADMADLVELAVKKGLYLSLPEAYDKAVRMNDQITPSITARSRVANDTEQALAAHQQAQRAKGAAVSVSGSPNGTAASTHVNPNDLRSVIAAQLTDSGARV